MALEAYGHFTSPIRRYPDLLVHRGICHILEGKKAATFRYSQTDIESAGAQCSMTERRADDATRDVNNWLKCEYMRERVGQEFDGTVISVVGFGLFVELNGIFVEGLVHVTSLPPDYYHHDAQRHTFTGERSGKVFRVGDAVRVSIAKVNLEDRKMDFELVSGGAVGEGDAPVKPAAKKRRR